MLHMQHSCKDVSNNVKVTIRYNTDFSNTGFLLDKSSNIIG